MNNFLGNIEQFNEEDMDWPSYVERLELFLECNGIADNEAKKVKMALTLMGGKVFAVAKDVCFPGKPQEEKWEDLKIEQTEKDLREETNVQDVHKLHEQRFFKSRPHHIGPTRNFPSSSSKMTPSSPQGYDNRSDMHCVCCGRNGHMIRNCRFRYYKCHECGSQGHLKKMCKQGQNQRQHFVSEMEMHQEEEEDDETLSYLLSIENQLNYVDKFQVSTLIEGKTVQFELDTGASVSIISEKLYNEYFKNIDLQRSNLKLAYWGNERVHLLGYIRVNVMIASEQRLCDLYILKGNGCALLGRNWISMFESLKQIFKCFQDNSLHQIISCDQVKRLIEIYPEVFSQKLGKYSGDKVKLKLNDNAKPKFFQPRSVPLMLKSKVEAELERLENEGIITKVSYSQWGTPIVPVMKPNGDIRICGDYKITINPHLQLERHPIPRIEELLIGIKTGGKFTILDLSHAYQQMELDDEAKELVAISTHKGVYFYNRMPFGISPAPGIFQKRISEELRDIENVKVYFDEILIFGDNQNTHFEALCKVLDKLKVMGLTVSQDKCKFFQDQTKFLGYVIDKNGIRPSQEKTQAIVYAPEPENVKQLQSFLGLVNYYRKFLPDLSSIQKPLNDLLCKGAEFKFDETCKQSFNKIKELLSQDNALLHFDTNKPIILACDASAYGISAVLLQHDENGNEKPVAFASRRLNKAEENYSQVDKEALSIIFGVKKFDQHLWGQKFKIRSDCKALVSIFGSKHGFPQMAASRLQRYAVFLSGYNFDIEYITSEKNVLADALSRLPLHTSNEGYNSANYLKFICENNVLDTKKIQSETDKDNILSKIKTYVLSGWPDKSLMSEIEIKYYNKKEELTIEDGIIMWGYRVVVPASCISHLLNELHLNHLGITKMKSIARSYFWWPSMDSDIEKMSNTCVQCLQNRPEQKKVSLHMWEYPMEPWRRIHVDFLGPFRGKTYLVVEDAFSKWIEVFKMNSTNCQSVVEKLYELFARFGLPDYLVSDNGSPFQSRDFATFLKNNGIVHRTSPPYYPQCNGQAESAVKIIKGFLKKMPDDRKLQRFLFDYRISKHTTTNKSPAELLQNRALKTRFDLLKPTIEKPEVEQEIKIEQQKINNKDYSKSFEIGETVLVRDYKNPSIKWRSGVVHKKVGNVIYLVLMNNNQVWKRHVDQMMKFKGEKSLNIGGETQGQSYVYLNTNAEDVPVSNDSENEQNDDTYVASEPDTEELGDDESSVSTEEVYQSCNENENNEPRYPKRINRRPPDRYNPSDFLKRGRM
ncbi:hypothetical protein M8J77_017390 [Diaphorina citri]|nr:hypothetical protein M8J77_017390 [Diaphorina citri]